jgi:glutamate-1-semialdehyde 2,1-aminomutase
MEQWLISTQHDEADIDRFLANFDRLAAALAD